MGFPRQEQWSGLLVPSPEDLPDPGIELASLALAGRSVTTEPPGKHIYLSTHMHLQVCLYICIVCVRVCVGGQGS